MLNRETRPRELGINDPGFWTQAYQSLVRGMFGAFVFGVLGGVGSLFLLGPLTMHNAGSGDGDSAFALLIMFFLFASPTVGFSIWGYTNQKQIGHRHKLTGLGFVVGGFLGLVLCLLFLSDEFITTIISEREVGMVRFSFLSGGLVSSVEAGAILGGLIGFAIGSVRLPRRDDEARAVPVNQLPLWDRELDG